MHLSHKDRFLTVLWWFSARFDRFFDNFGPFEYHHTASERSVQPTLDHLATPALCPAMPRFHRARAATESPLWVIKSLT